MRLGRVIDPKVEPPSTPARNPLSAARSAASNTTTWNAIFTSASSQRHWVHATSPVALVAFAEVGVADSDPVCRSRASRLPSSDARPHRRPLRLLVLAGERRHAGGAGGGDLPAGC